MTIDWNDAIAINKLYNETFPQLHCDWVKANGETCRLMPAWRDAKNDQLLCYVHVGMRWSLYREEAENASAVHTRG